MYDSLVALKMNPVQSWSTTCWEQQLSSLRSASDYFRCPLIKAWWCCRSQSKLSTTICVEGFGWLTIPATYRLETCGENVEIGFHFLHSVLQLLRVLLRQLWQIVRCGGGGRKEGGMDGNIVITDWVMLEGVSCETEYNYPKWTCFGFYLSYNDYVSGSSISRNHQVRRITSSLTVYLIIINDAGSINHALCMIEQVNFIPSFIVHFSLNLYTMTIFFDCSSIRRSSL